MPRWGWLIVFFVVVAIIGLVVYFIRNPPSDSSKKPPSDSSKNPQSENPDDTRKCMFETQDLKSNKLVDKKGNIITKQPKALTCNKCGGYYYKEDKKCVPYMFEEDENSADGSAKGVCTISLGTAEPCPF